LSFTLDIEATDASMRLAERMTIMNDLHEDAQFEWISKPDLIDFVGGIRAIYKPEDLLYPRGVHGFPLHLRPDRIYIKPLFPTSPFQVPLHPDNLKPPSPIIK
jgi:hypothetical protein